MKIRTVYVAGPISSDPIGGTRNALAAATVLIKHGFAPFVPHLAVFWELTSPLPYEDWLRYDLVWLERCDALLRLDGESPGADREVARAIELEMPVYYTVAALLAAVRA